jgi:hypothetical protein
LCGRSGEIGHKAIDEMPEACKGKFELLLVDVSKENSVMMRQQFSKESL